MPKNIGYPAKQKHDTKSTKLRRKKGLIGLSKAFIKRKPE